MTRAAVSPGGVVAGYETAATAERIAAWEAIDCGALLAHIADFLPPAKASIVDLGAGTGRDAAWLARRGYRVTAVEPAARLRRAGTLLHSDQPIEWLDDRLPYLAHLDGRVFDAALCVAVWQHLDRENRAAAMARIAGLLNPGGRLLLSLRHGLGAPERPVCPCDPSETVEDALQNGLVVLRRAEAASMQPGNHAKGVSWTWLAFERP